MNRDEAIEPNQAIELAKSLLNSGFGADVVTGGEDVRGIETDAKALRLVNIRDDVRNLFEMVTET